MEELKNNIRLNLAKLKKNEENVDYNELHFGKYQNSYKLLCNQILQDGIKYAWKVVFDVKVPEEMGESYNQILLRENILSSIERDTKDILLNDKDLDKLDIYLKIYKKRVLNILETV